MDLGVSRTLSWTPIRERSRRRTEIPPYSNFTDSPVVKSGPRNLKYGVTITIGLSNMPTLILPKLSPQTDTHPATAFAGVSGRD